MHPNFVSYSSPALGGAHRPYRIVEIDFRHGAFGGWATSFIDAMDPSATAVEAEDVRAALAALAEALTGHTTR